MDRDTLVQKARRPFRPFVVRTTDGRLFPCVEPFTMAVGKYNIVVSDEDGDPVFIPLDEVQSAEDITPGQAAAVLNDSKS